jgi:uncharacterized coiled-coil protein SlyX
MIIFVIMSVFAYAIIFSEECNLLRHKERLNFVFPLLGWFIAFSLVILQINKNRQDNKDLKKHEIKKSLQIEAFKQINLSITECSKIYTGIQVDYSMLAGKLKFNSQNSNFDFHSFVLPFYSNQYSADLHKGHYIFKRAMEANEIAVIEFNHVDKKLFLEIHRLSNHIDKFSDFIGKNSQQSLLNQNYKEFDRKSNEISQMMLDIQCYLHDFRIILMNHFLEDIFDAKVPNRNPNDENIKTLNELVENKEEVEKEFEKLEKSLFFLSNSDDHKKIN